MNTHPHEHWSRWYSKKRWRRLRRHQLRAEPLCRFCTRDGKAVPANFVDHVERHFGDPDKFWFGALQSLCWNCHESHKKFIEARGYARDVGVDGWPIDPHHPANLPRSAIRKFGFSIPDHIRPSAIPVTLVCGPPRAGKTTWINQHKRFGDTVISLDECKVRCGGRPWDTDRSVLRRALVYRDTMLRALATQKTGCAFVEVAAPTQEERDAWCQALGTTNVVLLDVPAAVCLARIEADPALAHTLELTQSVARWHYVARTKQNPINSPEVPI
jgi:5-methylcytosine-specific restriction enzyme A